MAMAILVLLGVLGSVAVGICLVAVRLGRRPDPSFLALIHLYRLFGLPNPGLLSDWPRRQLRANRDELERIADYRNRSRQRA
jgi:hypothetical protein